MVSLLIHRKPSAQPERYDTSLARRRARSQRCTSSAHRIELSVAQDLSERAALMNGTFRRALAVGWAKQECITMLLHARAEIESLKVSDLCAVDGGEVGSAAHDSTKVYLPLADGSFDIVFSLFHMQWFNDHHNVLSEIRRVLAVGGLCLLVLAGARSFGGLRRWLEQQGVEADAHVGVLPDTKDIGAAAQRVGLVDAVSDSFIYRESFKGRADLVRCIRRHGVGAVTPAARRSALPRAVARQIISCRSEVEECIEAITLTAWRSQSSFIPLVEPQA